MLADAGGDDRLVEPAAVLDDVPKPLDGVLRQDGVVAVGVAQRLGLAPLLDLANPVGVRRDRRHPPGLLLVQELACAFVEKLPVKVLLLNNQHLGMVVQWEDRFYESNRAHTYLGAGFDKDPYPDFVMLARGFGVGARAVSRKEDLDAALTEMLDTKGPFVLNVLVPYQEHVLPMIPGGMTVRDIIKA